MKTLLRLLDSLVSFVLLVALTVAGAYSVYALWDNEQIYSAAENVQAEMLSLKPKVTAPAEDGQETPPPSFDDLKAVNPDVCAWLELYDTKIDHPVLHGEDNLEYINTDVYGNFALAGSIFLDSVCDNTFADTVSLLHGHHMDNRKMFGDLDLYKEKEFFDGQTGGLLILPDRTCQLEIFACIIAPSSEKTIYDPGRWQASIDGLLDYTEANALHKKDDVLARLRTSENPPQILAMSTCSSEFTDARTILLAAMNPTTPPVNTQEVSP